MAKNWIKGAVKHPGALHRDLGIPEDKKIPRSRLESAAHGNDKTAKRARLALTFRSMDHKHANRSDADKAHLAGVQKAMMDD